MNKQVFPYNVGLDCGNGVFKLKISGHGQDFDYIRFSSYYVDVTNLGISDSRFVEDAINFYLQYLEGK